MKKLIALLALMAATAQAADSVYIMDISNVSTGALVSTNTTTAVAIGEIDSINIIRSGATSGATNTLTIEAVASSSYAAKTLFSTQLIANCFITPQAVSFFNGTTNGAAFPFPLAGQQIRARATDANVTGQNVRAYIVIKQ